STLPMKSSVHRCHVVEDIVGQGSFGMVAKCRNTETNNSVAVKVIRGTEDFVDSAISEIAALKRLRCLDSDTCNIVQWNGFFFDKENICIAFELLDQSLRYYLQEEKSWGLSVGELRPILHQVATALSHLHSIGVVHMDLKPDNIMIVDRHQHPLKVKLIDFGLAHPVSALKQGDSMGTLWYFAPEMLLGVPFDESIDMWALGLIMAELAMGCTLYPGEVEYDVLRFIVETQGQPPDDVLDQTRKIKLNSLDGIEQAMGEDIEHRNDQKLFIMDNTTSFQSTTRKTEPAVSNFFGCESFCVWSMVRNRINILSYKGVVEQMVFLCHCLSSSHGCEQACTVVHLCNAVIQEGKTSTTSGFKPFRLFRKITVV
uniref:Protein kinase domain-containing protein n=1 Tax=Stegastes partitus TaxID=144197 RepID=A0A3B5ADA0_9TELE